MWELTVDTDATVYLNFRSENHVAMTVRQKNSLLDREWALLPDFQSAVSTGAPNGPYSGPVYSKARKQGLSSNGQRQSNSLCSSFPGSL